MASICAFYLTIGRQCYRPLDNEGVEFKDSSAKGKKMLKLLF